MPHQLFSNIPQNDIFPSNPQSNSHPSIDTEMTVELETEIDYGDN